MSVNSVLTGNYRNPNAVLRCESMSCETLTINSALKENVSDVAVLNYPSLNHTFNANLNDVFLFDITLLASANFVNASMVGTLITISNIKPNTFVKASILRVLDANGGIGFGYKMSSFINYANEGTYNIFITNETGSATPFAGIISVMVEQVLPK
jgi:hypothetical protein